MIPIGSKVYLCDDAQAICDNSVGWNSELERLLSDKTPLNLKGHARNEVHGVLAVVEAAHGFSFLVPIQTLELFEVAEVPDFDPGDLVLVTGREVVGCIQVWRGMNDYGLAIVELLLGKDHRHLARWSVPTTELVELGRERLSLYELDLVVERYEDEGGPPVRGIKDLSFSIVLPKAGIDFEHVADEVHERYYPDWNHWLLIRWEAGDRTWLKKCWVER